MMLTNLSITNTQDGSLKIEPLLGYLTLYSKDVQLTDHYLKVKADIIQTPTHIKHEPNNF